MREAGEPSAESHPKERANRLFNRVVFKGIFQPRGEGRII